MIIQQGDMVRFRELTDKEEEDDAWGDDWFFAGKTFQVVEKGEKHYALYCEDLPQPYGTFHKSFFDEWEEEDFVIIKEVK